MDWSQPYYQPELETAPAPLDWVSGLQAAMVGRGSLHDPDALAELLHEAVRTGGFCVIGVTAGKRNTLPLGVLSRSEWPEYFTAYRQWVAGFPASRPHTFGANGGAGGPGAGQRVPRCEIRIAGLGGHGIKLAGTVLAEAVGRFQGLWTTQRGDYGSATRGGPSLVDVVAGSDPITYPGADRPDVLVVLSQGAASRYAGTQKAGGFLVADPAEVSPLPPEAVPVPVTGLARQHTGSPIAAGMVSLGCLAALRPDVVTLEALRQGLAEHMPARLLDRNWKALEAGYAATAAAAGAGLALEGAPHG
jgi:2-oxoglutarate ferredoxin oxidoreductase subunit gamma